MDLWLEGSSHQVVTPLITLNPLSQFSIDGMSTITPSTWNQDLIYRLANPSPLGLMGFGATTFILSMFNLRAGGVMEPNVVLGMALGYGGLVQLIAGIEEFVCGNTFAATAFSSYGGFWFSFGSKSTHSYTAQ